MRFPKWCYALHTANRNTAQKQFAQTELEYQTMNTARFSCVILCASALAISVNAQSWLTNGLVAHYPLDGDTSDASGHGNDGVAVGATPTTNRFGVPNKCYRFDGNGQYIVAPGTNLPTGQRTISVWFKANRLDTRPAILGYGTTCGSAFFMALNHYGDQSYTVTTHCRIYEMNIPFTNAVVNSWYHWAVVMDDQGMSFYLNGQRFGSRLGTSTTEVAGSQLGLGTISSTVGEVPYSDVNVGYLDGYLDDVRIYERAFSAVEVLALYDVEGGGGGVISPFFAQNPVSRVVRPGGDCTFTATAIGTPPPAYQWQFNGANISGATNDSYTLSSVSATNVGWYSVVAASPAGTNTSSVSLALFDISFGNFGGEWLNAARLDAPTGSTYRIESKSELAPGPWTTLSNVTVNLRPFVVVDDSSVTNQQQFYRVVPE